MRFSIPAFLLFSYSHIGLRAQSAVLALSSANASPATTVTLDLIWASSGVSASGLQWTLTYPPVNVSAVSLQTGPVLTAASKTITCAASAGKRTCLAVGVNSTVIPVGVVARAVFTLTPSATTSIIGISQTLAASALGVPIAVTAVSGAITINAPAAPTLSGLTCSPTSLIAPGSAACAVTLTAPPSSATTVALSSSHSAVSVPSTVTLPAGAATATFTASSTAVTAPQSATVSATLGTTTKTATLTVQPPPAAVSVLQCSTSTLASGGSAACSVALTAASPAGGTAIALSASSPVIAVPSQVTVPAGATSIGFTANASTVITSQTVTVTASLSGLTKTLAITVLPPGAPLFRLAGEPSELQGGPVNNATVVPAINTVPLLGKLIIAGSGTATFASAYLGNGVRFGQTGAQNQNTAFYRFTGTALANLLGRNQGDISFYLKSAYSFAERSANASDNIRWIFDAHDETARRFTFCVLVSGGRLLFLYQIAGSLLQTYPIPPGQEDLVFGKSVIAKIRLHWDGSGVNLFVNDISVRSGPYTSVNANWTAASFTIGAVESRQGVAGYYASDDLIDEFEIR